MGDVVSLIPDRQKLIENRELIVDLARFAEGLADEKAIRKKYRLGDAVWDALGTDDEFVCLILDEKTDRIRTGQQKRERSQQLITKGPAILDSIAADVSASPRHRVDALKVLNDFAANPADHTPASLDRFIIRIDLSAGGGGSDDVLEFNKSIAIDVNNGDGTDAPRRPLPITNKWDDDDVVPARTGYADRESASLMDQQHAAPDAATMKRGKAAKQKTGKVVERSAYEIALESLMQFED